MTKVHRLEIGFRTKNKGAQNEYESVKSESEMLTGDDNIVDISAVVQYLSFDAYKWQFIVEDPSKLMYFLSQSAIRLVVGKSSFDQVATNDKAGTQAAIEKVLQDLCDEIDFGAKIISVQLQDVDPPKPVAPSFKAVVSAKEDQARIIFEAHKHRNKVVPEARGLASQIINDAKGYAAKRIADANGDVAKFNEILKEYEEMPEITTHRLTFEALTETLPGSRLVIDKGERDSSIFKILNLDTPSEKKE